ncbi:hypothetical protein COCSUDRAFT_44273 [Coccomyxa subellipsoidea C-169]|uniref:Malectin domain-containing protein n=1 Tax=Coccomyxa subellipsoidea (strain C-169) TaxID=574566 RepID=I0YN85_COCSC|nr:hypothetical protein COCSUDRAFT_44273 [Coccomyxa subellipsoidea C-169]EIE19854.1 hypothetical protein COCSUDRAFT_44273 [Coccomyxa subellipsoidea C-169]|eukprot:XP_005644398.1 hypothetical protein COCSUDRAFT_44273 [Coccomyxa subellipsoidea C-169]
MRSGRSCVLGFLLAVSSQILLCTGAAPVELYIDAGNTDPSNFTDTLGHTWLPDQRYTGGGTEGFQDPITGAADGTGAIYQTNRLGGGFEYEFGPTEGLAAGHNYTVTLLFCELYFDSPGQRLFSVTANRNKSLLTNLDIYYAAGAYPCATSWCGKDVPLWETFQIAADAAGALSLQFTATVNNAVLAGIHISSGAAMGASPPPAKPALPPAMASGAPALGDPRPAEPPGSAAFSPQPAAAPGGPPPAVGPPPSHAAPPQGQLAGIVLGMFFGLLMILLIVTAVLALLSLRYLRKKFGAKPGGAVQIDAQA